MVPNPMNAAKLRDPLYIYYEIYNLGLNEKGITNYTVHFTLRQTDSGKSLFKKMTGLSAGPGNTASPSRTTAPEGRAP